MGVSIQAAGPTCESCTNPVSFRFRVRIATAVAGLPDAWNASARTRIPAPVGHAGQLCEERVSVVGLELQLLGLRPRATPPGLNARRRLPPVDRPPAKPSRLLPAVNAGEDPPARRRRRGAVRPRRVGPLVLPLALRCVRPGQHLFAGRPTVAVPGHADGVVALPPLGVGPDAEGERGTDLVDLRQARATLSFSTDIGRHAWGFATRCRAGRGVVAVRPASDLELEVARGERPWRGKLLRARDILPEVDGQVGHLPRAARLASGLRHPAQMFGAPKVTAQKMEAGILRGPYATG